MLTNHIIAIDKTVDIIKYLNLYLQIIFIMKNFWAFSMQILLVDLKKLCTRRRLTLMWSMPQH